MSAGIYGITYDGAVVYVGQSVNMRVRFGQHRCTLRNRTHRNFVLQRIFDKHPDSLGYTVLEEVAAAADLAIAEQRWMDRLNPAANLAKADGSHPHTEASRAKMRAYVRTPEHRAKLAAARQGKPPANKGISGRYKHTDEARKKIAAASRGRAPTPEVREFLSLSQKGRVFSDEHRAKLSSAKSGKPNEAVRKAMTGRKLAPEVIAKRVASFKATIERRRMEAVNASEQ